MDFTGAKVALFCNGKLIVFLRDNNPHIPNPNKWDFFGGGREGNETPEECAIREIEEELGVTLTEDAFIWKKAHPSLMDANRNSYFFVAEMTQEQMDAFVFTEGQCWTTTSVEEFLNHEDAIEGMKLRLNDYLSS